VVSFSRCFFFCVFSHNNNDDGDDDEHDDDECSEKRSRLFILKAVGVQTPFVLKQKQRTTNNEQQSTSSPLQDYLLAFLENKEDRLRQHGSPSKAFMLCCVVCVLSFF